MSLFIQFADVKGTSRAAIVADCGAFRICQARRPDGYERIVFVEPDGRLHTDPWLSTTHAEEVE